MGFRAYKDRGGKVSRRRAGEDGGIEGVNQKKKSEQQQGVTAEQQRMCLQLLGAQAAIPSIRLDAHITMHGCSETTPPCCCGNVA